MKKYIIFFTLTLLVVACGGGGDDLESKKNLLLEKKQDMDKLKAEIATLEKEIADLDPSFKTGNEQKTLVSVIPVARDTFQHFVEVQGKVETDNNVILSAETGGVVRSILVSEGQGVGAGQVLIQQDNNVLQKNVAELETSLNLAKTVYERQKSLWEQKIGTEIQYLEAQNQVQALESRLQTIQAQMAQSSVRAPFSGIVDEVYIKKGQMAAPGTQVLRLVSQSGLRVVAEVSESYLGKVKIGDKVLVEFPSLEVEKEANIVMIGQVINPDNRTFRIEVAVPNVKGLLKPDLIAKVKFQNYQKENTVVVPTNLLQRDKTGDFVFILVKGEDGKTDVAKKINVERGETYLNKTEILSGLNGDEKLIKDGFRDVANGSKIEIAGS